MHKYRLQAMFSIPHSGSTNANTIILEKTYAFVWRSYQRHVPVDATLGKEITK